MELNDLKKHYVRCFETDEGKLVLADLAKFCNYNNTSVCEQNPNALQTMFLEGERRVYLRILHMLRKDDK